MRMMMRCPAHVEAVVSMVLVVPMMMVGLPAHMVPVVPVVRVARHCGCLFSHHIFFAVPLKTIDHSSSSMASSVSGATKRARCAPFVAYQPVQTAPTASATSTATYEPRLRGAFTGWTLGVPLGEDTWADEFETCPP